MRVEVFILVVMQCLQIILLPTTLLVMEVAMVMHISLKVEELK